VRTFLDDVAIGGLDPHGAPFEYATMTVTRVRGENDTLLIGGDARHEVLEPASLELRRYGETARADLHLELR
jgi:hypothetical protein